MTRNNIGKIPTLFHSDLPSTHPFAGAKDISEFASRQTEHLARRAANQSALKARVAAVGENLRSRADSIRPVESDEAAVPNFSHAAAHAAAPTRLPKTAADAILLEADLYSSQARLQYKWKVRNELQRWIPWVGGALATGALTAGLAWYAVGMAFGIVTFSLAVLGLMALVSYFSLKPHLAKYAIELERLGNDVHLNNVRAIVPDSEVKARLKVAADKLPDLLLSDFSFNQSDRGIPAHRDAIPWKEMSLAESRARMIAAEQGLENVERSVRSALGVEPEPQPWYMQMYARFFARGKAGDVTTLQLDYWRERLKYWTDLNQILENSLPAMGKASVADCRAISQAVRQTRACVLWAQSGLRAAEAAAAQARDYDTELTDAFHATSAYWRQMAPAPTFAGTPTQTDEVLGKWRSGLAVPELPLPRPTVPRRAFEMDVADLRYYESRAGVRPRPVEEDSDYDEYVLQNVFPKFAAASPIEPFPKTASSLLNAILKENTTKFEADKGVIRDSAGETFELLKLVTDEKWFVFAQAVKEMTPEDKWPTSYSELSAAIVELTAAEVKRYAEMRDVMERFCDGEQTENDHVVAQAIEDSRGVSKALDDVLCEQLQKLTCESRYKRRLRDAYAEEMALTGVAGNLRNVLTELQARPAGQEASAAPRGVSAKHALLTGYRLDKALQRPLVHGEEGLVESILQRCIEQARRQRGAEPRLADAKNLQLAAAADRSEIDETPQLQALHPRPTVAEKVAAYAYYKSAIAPRFVGQSGAAELQKLLANMELAGRTVAHLALDVVAQSSAPDDVAALRAMLLRELFDVTKSALNQQNNSPHAIDLTPEGIRVTQAKFAEQIPCSTAYLAGLIAAAKVARLQAGASTLALAPVERFSMLQDITVSILRAHMPHALRRAAQLYWTLRTEVLKTMVGQWQNLEPAADEQIRLDRAMQIATNFRAMAGHSDVEWLEGEHRGALTRHYRAFLSAQDNERQEAQGRFQDAVGRLAEAALTLRDGALTGHPIAGLAAQHNSAAVRKARRLFGAAVKVDSASRVSMLKRGQVRRGDEDEGDEARTTGALQDRNLDSKTPEA